MKTSTDYQQSKELAEMLPKESADMWYVDWEDDGGLVAKVGFFAQDQAPDDDTKVVQAWSLSALIGVIPNSCIIKFGDEWECGSILGNCRAEDPIDACVEMIKRLKERGLI